MQPFFNPYMFPTGPPPIAGPYGNSALLNELHNNFPALLYDNRRFRGIHDVFQYVDSEMRNRFDTFSINQRQYRNANVPTVPTVANFQNIARPIGNNALSPIFSALFQREIVVDETNNQMDLLGQMFAGFTDAVPIVPSALDIQRGSTVHQVASASESPCAICQDVIAVGNIVRKLRGCNHIFHIDCIDTWYQRSVLCPTCRHDIRTTATPTNSATSTGSTSPQHMSS